MKVVDIRTVDVGNEFYYRLANRDQNQGDGKYTAIEFRKKYLWDLDNIEAWRGSNPFIVLDFVNVKKIGPSFANEVFAFFTQYANPEKILKRIILKNTTNVQLSIIKEELTAGYNNR